MPMLGKSDIRTMTHPQYIHCDSRLNRCVSVSLASLAHQLSLPITLQGHTYENLPGGQLSNVTY